MKIDQEESSLINLPVLAPLFDPPIFVGREEEIKYFMEMLANPEREKDWVFYIKAAGGMGKTKLLEEYIKLVKIKKAEDKNILFNERLFDFYYTAYQSETGLMQKIAEQLSPKGFKNFFEKLGYFYLKGNIHSETSIEILREAFLEDYKNLTADIIVLFFDTVEIESEGAKRFCDNFLGKMRVYQKGTLIVKAGREKLESKLPSHAVKKEELKSLKTTDIDQYLFKSGINISGEVRDKLLFLYQGKPILIALFIDWVKDGNTPEELVNFKTQVDFEQALITKVQDLFFPDNHAILLAAHFYQRFNSEILAFLLDITKKEAEKVIKHLARFSFVKYREKMKHHEESCLLHDEMRRLMDQYVWEFVDPNHLFRKEKTKKIITWYEDEIAKITHEENLTRKVSFQAELLYYKLSFDFDEGYKYWHELVSEEYRSYWEMRELFNKKFKKPEFFDQLSSKQQLEVKIRFVYVLLDQGSLEKGIEQLEKLLLISKDTSFYRYAKIFSRLIGALATTGNIERGLFLEKERLADFNVSRMPDNIAKNDRNKIEHQFGSIYNSIGFLYRVTGDHKNAVTYYHKAISFFKIAKKNITSTSLLLINEDYLARVENNLGYLLHLGGEDEMAFTYCLSALKRKQQLASPNQLGYSYNTLGIIESDNLNQTKAESYFDKATINFEKTKNPRGTALVLIAKGRMYRQLGWYRKGFLNDDTIANENFNIATPLLNGAIETLEKYHLDSADLVEVYYEKGLLCREQEDYETSEFFYLKGLNLARKLSQQINSYPVSNILQSISMTYFYLNRYQEAYNLAQESINKGQNYPHILSRAYKTLAEVAFSQGKYKEAFKHVGTSLLNRIKIDQFGRDNSDAKRNFLYQNWLHWIEGLLNKLPNNELKEEQGNYLIKQVEEGGKSFISKAAFRFKIETICEL